MTEETWRILAVTVPPLSVMIGRVFSHFEHKQTGKDVNEIKFYINGEAAKKIEDAREEGRQQAIKELQNKK